VAFAGANTYQGKTSLNGTLRAIDGVGLPASTNLEFNSPGKFESSGVFSRSLGTGAGQVRWVSNGGFSAFDGPMVVEIGGNASTLTWGSANFVPTGRFLDLSSATADNLVDFRNGLDLGGASRIVRVEDNPDSTTDVAQISGPISNGDLTKRGTGTLILTGPNTFNNANLEDRARLELVQSISELTRESPSIAIISCRSASKSAAPILTR
jgi:hypothetical protein